MTGKITITVTTTLTAADVFRIIIGFSRVWFTCINSAVHYEFPIPSESLHLSDENGVPTILSLYAADECYWRWNCGAFQLFGKSDWRIAKVQAATQKSLLCLKSRVLHILSSLSLCRSQSQFIIIISGSIA